MEDETYLKIKSMIKSRPKQLIDLEDWLYVVINTSKSIIDNTSKKDLDEILDFIHCETTSQIQLKFDTIQGKFGKDNFSQRYSPKYIYLCSLVANFSDKEISEKERELIKKYSMCNTYLLYEI